jgi:DNA-binding CsgD family transcriptional regulator
VTAPRPRDEITKEITAHLAALVRLFAELDRRVPTGERLLPQQFRVAVMVASTPLTNRAIGEHLGITEDTVKTVLRSVYRKLGVSRRGQLAAAMASRIEPAGRGR